MKLKKFENFNYADKVENLIDAETASKELVNMSSEELSAKEFGEYLEDYYNDPKSTNIDVNSLYYSAIVSAYEDISNVARSPKWQESDVENSEFYKEYKKSFSKEKYKGVTIDGLEYPISERSFDYLTRSANSQYAYASNSENFHNKRNIRVYNHTTKEHYYLENVPVEVGDEGLLFIDFPKTDAPRDSWSERATQIAIIRTWGHREGHRGEFVRYEITEIDKGNYCRIDDGYNKHKSGWYARDCFYKVIKIIKGK